MYTGTVRKWLTDRGFGFAELDGSGVSVFLHITQFSNRVAPPVGARVVMDVDFDTPRGASARVASVMED